MHVVCICLLPQALPILRPSTVISVPAGEDEQIVLSGDEDWGGAAPPSVHLKVPPARPRPLSHRSALCNGSQPAQLWCTGGQCSASPATVQDQLSSDKAGKSGTAASTGAGRTAGSGAAGGFLGRAASTTIQGSAHLGSCTDRGTFIRHVSFRPVRILRLCTLRLSQRTICACDAAHPLES